MSSDLKDARWEVAAALAKADGDDLYEMAYLDKSFYLGEAQRKLDNTDPAIIKQLAAEFRKNQ